MAYVRQNPNAPMYRMKVGTMPDFSGANYEYQDKLIGVQDGVNRLFTLKNRPVKETDKVYKDGMRMKRASSNLFTDGDYFIDYENQEVIFAINQVPQATSIMFAEYKYM